MPYQGHSIVDYLKSVGQPSDFASRSRLAASKGIGGYAGSAQQNIQLLNMLRSDGQAAPPQPTPQPQQPQQQQRPQPSPQQPQPGGWGSPTPGGPQSIQDLVSMGYTGYQGWTDQASALQNFRETGGAGKEGPTMGGGGGGVGITSGVSAPIGAPTINLPELYEKMYETSGISDIESKISERSKAYNEAVAKIKDNPYLSEATMVGRLKKLDDKFNADTAVLRDEVATKKADIETRLNIQIKQFDINSDQARLALDQFNSLLESGALNNAGGEDIASITRSTGLSSSMIQSAIQQQRSKNISTTMVSFDDGVNQGFALVNDRTGDIIKRNIVSTSKQKEETKKASVVEQRAQDKYQTQQNAVADIQAGSTLRAVIGHYAVSGGLTVEEVYRLYNANSPYGPAKEKISNVKKGIFLDEGPQ
jgi:hypothetical protein